MTSTKRIAPILVTVLALALSVSGASANCINFAGYAIFQCADTAYFNPPPVAIGFDPNNRPTNVTSVFWQLGFGNNEAGHCDLGTLKCTSGLIGKACSSASLPTPDAFCNGNNGLGSAGTGNSAPADFNGNDGGIFIPDLRDARVATVQPTLPAGALCLSVNNWANSGIDGCADNPRVQTQPVASDSILNPYYNVNYQRNYSLQGYYSLAWQQDYPMAALLQTSPDPRYFAIAAIATINRGSTRNGQNGPCCNVVGNNPAACDVRTGYYTFNDVKNGLPNPIVPGKFNIVPWQQIPKPKANCTANCAGSPRTIRFDWSPIVWYHDGSARPSTNPGLAPADATRAPGVGILDLLKKTDVTNAWQGLIHYDLESATASAANLDPNGRLIPSSLTFATAVADISQPAVDPNTGNPTATTISATTTAGPDTCWRLRVKFGKKPETTTTTTANCRLGKCGDRGFNVASTDGAVITCVGGALFSEAFSSVSALKGKGSVTVSWTVSAELTIVGYNVYAANAKGTLTKLNGSLIGCTECTSGILATYNVPFPLSDFKGAKGVVVEAIAQTNFRTNIIPIQ
jgi:hypothetical protein